MSDEESIIETQRQGVEGQTLVVGGGASHRRGSEVSELSQTSDLAESRRRVRGRRASRASMSSQAEGSNRKMKEVYPKVRTGCDTCKQRKIKCDETKPVCRNCTKSGRECLGYHPPQPKIFEPGISMPRSDSDMAHEARAMVSFKNETAIRLASYRPLQLSLDFWQNVVPALAVDNAPVRHAMLTLSATQEEYEGEVPDSLSTEWSKSLRQHTRAVRELWSGIAGASISNEATLVCCLLLTLYDIWHFGLPLSFTDIFGGFQHVFGGLNVCKFIKRTSPSKSPLPETTAINGTVMIPAFQHLADFAIVMLDDKEEEHLMLLREFALSLNPVIPGHFANADEAVDLLDRVLRQIAKIEPGAIATDLSDMEHHLSSILSTLQQSVSAAQARNDKVAAAGFRLLFVHHRAALILLNGTTTQSETLYDEHLADFEFIVGETEFLLREGPALPEKRVCIGIVPPLFLTATKCRDDSTRRRALAALHQSPHHEHLWTSCTAHQIAQQVIWLEEAGSGARVRLQSIKFDPAQSQVELKYDVQDGRNTSPDTSTFFWGRGSETATSEPPESFNMPRRMLGVAGYSAPILTLRQTACHCNPTGHFSFPQV